ncbi:MAG: hypothetical protein RLZ98_3660 [Pseudomonadota bacterium]|jgi:tripartite-type tricarboxylate transporter receptor subunit TctC
MKGTALCCLAAASCLLSTALAGQQPAAAQSVAEFYKGRNVSILVGVAPGGGSDTFARFLSQHLSAHMPGNPSFIVQHMPGAGGINALNHIYNTGSKDGTATILTAPSHTLAQIISGKNIRYDLLKMNLLGTLTRDTTSCAASGRSGIKSIMDAVDREIIVGATGPDASSAQQSRLLSKLLGLKIKIVTGYRGTAPVRLAMEAGEVDVVCSFWASQALGPQKGDMDAGRLVPIVQMGSKPHPAFGKAPVAYELAKSEEDRKIMRVVFGTTELSRPYLAPPGVPADRVAALRSAFWSGVTSAEAKADAERLRIILDPLDWEGTVKELRDIIEAPKEIVEKARTAVAR